MSASFLSLPKELKTYILSLYFVFHVFPDSFSFSCTYTTLTEIIEYACNDVLYHFSCAYIGTNVSRILLNFSLVHPTIRLLLKSSCKFSNPERKLKFFCFSQQFFCSIKK